MNRPAEDLPAELLTIIQLDAQEEDSVSAAQAAAIAHHDRDLLLALITTSEEEVIAWRASATDAAEQDDWDEAKACEHERKAWQRISFQVPLTQATFRRW